MKTLTLLRHAKSGNDPHIARDFDRDLNAKGKRAAVMIGAHARELGLAFDHIIASPAVRVVETVDAFCEGYGQTIAPTWDRRIYLASSLTLLDIIHAAPSLSDSLLIIGHNPGLEDIALLLAENGELREAAEHKFPTASIAQLHGPDAWSDWTAGLCALSRFVRPRDLDPALGPDTE